MAHRCSYSGELKESSWIGPSPKHVTLPVCDTLQIQTSADTALWLLPNREDWRTCRFDDAEQLSGGGMRSIDFVPQLECYCDGQSSNKVERLLASMIGCEDGKKVAVKVKPVSHSEGKVPVRLDGRSYSNVSIRVPPHHDIFIPRQRSSRPQADDACRQSVG